ncbi:phosphopantothenoylcysteine decarboxylase/phosphopantothenate/cysteine ligase [Anaeromyxobacter dehalogenans 2CP-1]|uniref:Coenzyme A biosynthesis bifunctional protein CoaBC n=1 Tax=Anaeromyxobacter dehalogenans (strain ATCC BAA-258 / DSM 21875 / 2CP-1) TaxID=455488 RepID=B8J576_ANAD2|nr:bifunctional phosphopantothenoylcysteine decarboxylase/phosphopantothenate--cysteine ligase CoaBC [Anaeromyxobacter dehalogenans]ACL64931.1 phosphopantothenoylcysteine decarboxylase/phosphopantothenate/cysteine ligase [Anaeromyxobacter dehalogenans 2CP-1]
MDFRNRTVVVCVGGGIAAYKACDLTRLIVKGNGKVRVAMTPAATRFVAPLTFQALSGAPVLTDLFEPAADLTYGHLEMARVADLVVVAPATADLIARIRAGMADDAVTTAVLAATCPVLLAPAMNTRMWRNVATQENLAALRARGMHVVGPAAGLLADGDVGEGRLAEPQEIALAAARLLGRQDLAGRKVLVTAGPTREPIDPVRFVSNPSSGKMGYAVARVAARRGAQVTLVSGPTALEDPSGVEVVRVETAEEMARAVESAQAEMDLFVGAAAVSDYRPAAPAAHKLKKKPGEETLVLARTPDILAGLGARHAGRPGAPVLVGFAAETEEVIARAREKLKGKRCDLVVANKVGAPGAGFGGDTNRVALVSAAELAEIEGTKDKVAEAILDWILPVLDARRPRG